MDGWTNEGEIRQVRVVDRSETLKEKVESQVGKGGSVEAPGNPRLELMWGCRLVSRPLQSVWRSDMRGRVKR